MLQGGGVRGGRGGGIKGDLALVAGSRPLFEALADLYRREVEMEGDGRVCVGVVFNTMETNRI